ncbi:MAG: hypothetical protein NWF05_05410 [Candidatus Bathyarchaeota archaeon]|nr:hypothetical protein [Candidatus Bathyarchaeota archaeon]
MPAVQDHLSAKATAGAAASTHGVTCAAEQNELQVAPFRDAVAILAKKDYVVQNAILMTTAHPTNATKLLARVNLSFALRVPVPATNQTHASEAVRMIAMRFAAMLYVSLHTVAKLIMELPQPATRSSLGIHVVLE